MSDRVYTHRLVCLDSLTLELLHALLAADAHNDLDAGHTHIGLGDVYELVRGSKTGAVLLPEVQLAQTPDGSLYASISRRDLARWISERLDGADR